MPQPGSDDASGSFWSLGWVGGDVIIDRFSRTDTAYVHRDVVHPAAADHRLADRRGPASVGDELNAWTDQVISRSAPHTPDESYQNFPNRMT